jgi:N-acetylneuraminic acid mutarotase
LLPDGKVLITGGVTRGMSYLSTSEVYDPIVGKWTKTSPANQVRAGHTATLLLNGQVLVAGGHVTLDVFGNVRWLSSAELYNPSNKQWAETGNMTTTRMKHTATLLQNGKVLVVGGYDGTNNLSSAELYDPKSGKWMTTGSLIVARRDHTATLLSDGKVLVAGGENATDCLSSAELYNPNTEKWTITDSMNSPRKSYRALLLPNGLVLATGGIANETNHNDFLSSTELYKP